MGLVCFMWQILLLPFCKGGGAGRGNKTKTPSLAGILSHTIWEGNEVQPHFPTVWSLNLVLGDDRVYIQEASVPKYGALLKRLTLIIPWWGSRHRLQGRPWVNSHHTALDSLSTDKAPKSTWPRTLWRQFCRCLVFFLSQGYLSHIYNGNAKL